MVNKKTYFFALIVVLCLVLLVYSNSLHNPFIWDDNAIILRNPLIKEGYSLGKIFTSDLYYGAISGSNFYRPMQTLSYMQDYYFWGFSPLGYHLTNILLHSLASFMVFVFVFVLSGELMLSLFSALLFAVNPLHTEAVTYISGRAEMLMGIFLLGAFILFVRKENSGGRSYRLFYLLSLAAFVFALLSKELSVFFPLAIWAYLFYIKTYPAKITFRKVFPFLAVSLGYIFLRATFLKFPTIRPPTLATIPLFLRITVLPKVLFTYLKLLFLPVNLHMSRELIRPTSFLGIFFSWFALGMLVVFAVSILRRRDENKLMKFLCAWFFIFLLPQSGVLPINTFVAEHFLYLSSISFFIGVYFFLRRYLKRQLFLFSIVCLVVSYGMLTYARNFEWREPLLFFRRIVELSPSSFQGYNNLGLEYEKRGEFQEAIKCYKKASQLNPGLLEAHSNLANLYFKTGRLKEALDEYLHIENMPIGVNNAEIQSSIGSVLENQGLIEEAKHRYKAALKLNNKLYFTHFNLARIYLAEEKVELSVEEIISSLGLDNERLKEDITGIRRIITRFLAEKKMFSSAAVFYNNLGVRLAKDGFFYAANSAFERALELEPFYRDAHFNLGLSYLKMGMVQKAVFQLKLLIKEDPGYYRAKRLLSQIQIKKDNK